MKPKTISIVAGMLLATFSGAVFAAPEGVTPPGTPVDMTAKADAKGLLKATVTFTAPTTAPDGSQVELIDRITLCRDGKEITSFQNVKPGSELTYTDTSIAMGNNYYEYSATAYFGKTAGETVKTAPVFVGVDIPLAPKSFKASDGGDRITFTWAKSGRKGEQGERVVPDQVKYILSELNDSYTATARLTETTGQTYLHYFPTDLGVQDIKRFSVVASNSAGQSQSSYVRMVIGAPYYIPYRESFATGVARGLVWQEGDGYFTMITDNSADSDAGSLLCEPGDDGQATSFNLGKILLAHTKAPRLSFRIAGLGADDTMTLRVARPDGAEATLLTVKGPVEDWRLYTVDLTPLKSNRYIIPKFRIEKGNRESFMLDDIRVEDPYSHDLGLFISAPSLASGQTTVKITATNEGTSPCADAGVRLFADDRLISTHKLVKELQPGESETIETSVNIIGTTSVEVKATVDWIFDVNPANDTAIAQIMPQENPDGDSPESGVGMAGAEFSGPLTVFTPEGIRIKAEKIGDLLPGLYIINGKKTVITKP